MLGGFASVQSNGCIEDVGMLGRANVKFSFSDEDFFSLKMDVARVEEGQPAIDAKQTQFRSIDIEDNVHGRIDVNFLSLFGNLAARPGGGIAPI